MTNKKSIIIMKSSVPGRVPTADKIKYGQMAINYADEKFFFKNSENVVKEFSFFGHKHSKNDFSDLTLSTVAETGSFNDLSDKPIVDQSFIDDSTNAISSKVVKESLDSKSDKSTTLDGYGITDVKIEDGSIVIGENSITPLTQHQDISNKADKATTLDGYGITDVKIEDGSIVIGENSITPLTEVASLSTVGGIKLMEAKFAQKYSYLDRYFVWFLDGILYNRYGTEYKISESAKEGWIVQNDVPTYFVEDDEGNVETFAGVTVEGQQDSLMEITLGKIEVNDKNEGYVDLSNYAKRSFLNSYLHRDNNLSEITNKTMAVKNLGLGRMVQVDPYTPYEGDYSNGDYSIIEGEIPMLWVFSNSKWFRVNMEEVPR